MAVIVKRILVGYRGCDSVREERQGFWLGIDGCDRETRILVV